MAEKFFALTHGKFAAEYREQIILLDITNNEYLSLGKETGLYLKAILKYSFHLENNCYSVHANNGTINEHLDNINTFLHKFLNENIIEETHSRVHSIITTAKKHIGLNTIEWNPHKTNLDQPISFFEFIKTWLHLAKVQKMVKRGKLGKLFSLMNRYARKRDKLYDPDRGNIERIVLILEKACLFYPKETLCLAKAATLAILFLKKGWRCQFVIGIQTLPFYAHAWLEQKEVVINDNPLLQERLAPIFKLNFD